MPPKPPRFLPTVALAVLWLALYFLWLAVRPDPAAVTQPPERPTPASATTTTSTTPRPLLKLKP
jgi:hypothetical protein